MYWCMSADLLQESNDSQFQGTSVPFCELISMSWVPGEPGDPDKRDLLYISMLSEPTISGSVRETIVRGQWAVTIKRRGRTIFPFGAVTERHSSATASEMSPCVRLAAIVSSYCRDICEYQGTFEPTCHLVGFALNFHLNASFRQIKLGLIKNEL